MSVRIEPPQRRDKKKNDARMHHHRRHLPKFVISFAPRSISNHDYCETNKLILSMDRTCKNSHISIFSFEYLPVKVKSFLSEYWNNNQLMVWPLTTIGMTQIQIVLPMSSYCYNTKNWYFFMTCDKKTKLSCEKSYFRTKYYLFIQTVRLYILFVPYCICIVTPL